MLNYFKRQKRYAKVGNLDWLVRHIYINIFIYLNLTLFSLLYFKLPIAAFLCFIGTAGYIISLLLLKKKFKNAAVLNITFINTLVILCVPYLVHPLYSCILFFAYNFIFYSAFETNFKRIIYFGIINFIVMSFYIYSCVTLGPKLNLNASIILNLLVGANICVSIYNLFVEFVFNLKKTNLDLSSSKRFIEKMINITPNIIYTINEDQKFEIVNFAYEREIKCPRNQIIGRTLYEILRSNKKVSLKNDEIEDLNILKGKKKYATGTIKITDNKGGVKIFNYKKLPIIENDGSISGLICVMNDISEILSQNETIEHHKDVLKSKNEELQEYIKNNLELESFAQIASHDLKTPLRSISNFSQLLKRNVKDKLNTEENEFVDFILSSSVSMQNLINDLLEYSITSKKELDLSFINMNLLYNDVLDVLSASIKETDAIIEFKNVDSLKLIGDRLKIKQLFINMISNAIKYRKKYVPPRITITYQRFKYNYQFTITDNGIGIADEFKEKIFLILKRLHNKTEYDGTGIGLATCKNIVDKHQGKIWVESELGKGSKFYFTIQKFDLQNQMFNLEIKHPDVIYSHTGIKPEVNSLNKKLSENYPISSS